ncbi:MAG: M3 family oligoendopeptidase [Acidimicrobiales bacterium]|nr:M3 family oligoendopeptidase [Acidimicrobiales bacterium]
MNPDVNRDLNSDVNRAVNPDALPRWSTADVYESFDSRAFVDAMERLGSDVDRLVALFDEAGIRNVEPRTPTADDADATARAIDAYNQLMTLGSTLRATAYATVATDTRDEPAQAVLSEIDERNAVVTPLLARLADWVSSLGVDELAALHPTVADHAGPLRQLSARAAHQMGEAEEHLYAELATTGSAAWSRLHREVTSQITAEVALPDGARAMPITAVRGLATHTDPAVRRAGYDAELAAWPTVATVCAAAMNSIKGEANAVNRRRRWASPLDASLFANSVSRRTYDAMNAAIDAALPRFRRWMRTKAALHGHDGALPWWDLTAPLPVAPGGISWDEGVRLVREAFSSYSAPLASLVDRAIAERWIDVAPRDGKVGGAFCMSFVDDRSLVLLNWSGSVDSAQTTAHELGHAYHNTQLAHRTALQRRLPMALAETASIFCETLVVDAGLQHLQGADRLALLDVDLQGTTQVVVDIRSRVLFETEVYARRQRRTLGAGEMHEMMRDAQAASYGDGLDQSTAHPYMWIVKPHYYGSNFYNWPYTYGLLFGLGLFAEYQADPERFQAGYDDLLSRAGMDSAEELGAAFGLDVTSEAFWTASLEVIGDRIDQYAALAAELGVDGAPS